MRAATPTSSRPRGARRKQPPPGASAARKRKTRRVNRRWASPKRRPTCVLRPHGGGDTDSGAAAVARLHGDERSGAGRQRYGGLEPGAGRARAERRKRGGRSAREELPARDRARAVPAHVEEPLGAGRTEDDRRPVARLPAPGQAVDAV